ncbi:hypothetical protein KC320_g199 [Hortaea werneckii]|nr:hypothetical protein KC320_g199 [Hortaea werneckii]
MPRYYKSATSSTPKSARDSPSLLRQPSSPASLLRTWGSTSSSSSSSSATISVSSASSSSSPSADDIVAIHVFEAREIRCLTCTERVYIHWLRKTSTIGGPSDRAHHAIRIGGLRLAKGRGMHTVYSIVLKYETTLNAGTGCERPNPSKRVARAHPLAQVEPE